jgi:hypothetical protein
MAESKILTIGDAMNSARALVASVVLLGLGLGLIFGYCHDSTISLGAAHPAAGAAFKMVINTNGWPAMLGPIATLIGVLFFFAALVQAVLTELKTREVRKHEVDPTT